MFSLKKIAALAAPVVTALGITGGAATAQPSYIGEIFLVGYSFCPRASVEAAGQLVAISSNTALFSLYGTQFGGDGRTTFGMPDLRGRLPMGNGFGPGLTPRVNGQEPGFEQVQLTLAQLPAHNHNVRVNNTGGDKRRPGNDYLSYSTLTEILPPDQVEKMYASTATPGVTLDTNSLTNAGGGLPHTNLQPVQVLRYCIVEFGIFPSRN